MGKKSRGLLIRLMALMVTTLLVSCGKNDAPQPTSRQAELEARGKAREVRDAVRGAMIDPPSDADLRKAVQEQYDSWVKANGNPCGGVLDAVTRTQNEEARGVGDRDGRITMRVKCTAMFKTTRSCANAPVGHVFTGDGRIFFEDDGAGWYHVIQMGHVDLKGNR